MASLNLLDTVNSWLGSRSATPTAAPSTGTGTFSPWAQDIQSRIRRLQALSNVTYNPTTGAQQVNLNALRAGQKAAGPPPRAGAIYDPSAGQWFMQTPDANTNSTAIQWLGRGMGGQNEAPAQSQGTGSGYGGSGNASAGGPKFPPYMQPPDYWQQALPYAQWGQQFQMPPFYQKPMWMQGPGLLG